MNKNLRHFALVMVAFMAVRSSSASCDSLRYYSKIFTSFTKTTVTYSSAYNQQMNIYTPDGDVSTSRKAIIFAHGGSFISGDRNEAFLDSMCRHLALRGYVTASIDYRLATGAGAADMLDSVKAFKHVMQALSDAKAAVRFFRDDAANANTFKVDTNWIVFGGNSAGAILATHLAYVKSLAECTPLLDTAIANTGGLDGNSGYPNHSSKVKAVLNYAGALLSLSMINPNDVEPIYSAQGDQDATVPYNCGQVLNGTSNIKVCGSGAMRPVLVANATLNQLHTFPGDGHVPWVTDLSKANIVETETVNFLYALICNPSLGIGDVASDVAINLYPNPANDMINVTSSERIQTVTVIDPLGRELMHQSVTGTQSAISVSALPAGIYSVRVSLADSQHTVVRSFVKE